MKRLHTLLFALAAAAAGADVRLPRLLPDHLVLQREQPVAVWGWADAGEKVTVRFRGHEAAAAADRDGRWRVSLPATEAGGPFELAVSGRNTITLADVFVGDVWLCSGQSNMERRLDLVADGEREIAAASDTGIR